MFRFKKKLLILFIFIIFLTLYTIAVIQIEAYLNHSVHTRKAHNLLDSNADDYDKTNDLLQNLEKHRHNQYQSPTQKQHEQQIIVKSEVKQYKKETKKPQDPKQCIFKKHQFYPHCEGKISYLKAFWSEDCFKKLGVDGSDCSIFNYLTQIEPYCPPNERQSIKQESEYASPRFDIEGLLKHLPGDEFEWMRQRAINAWADWVHAGNYFQSKYQRYRNKKVALFMGSMSFQPHLMKFAGKGGPLGELIQWTDIICGLYVLGYDINVYLNTSKMNLDVSNDGCAAGVTNNTKNPEVIYTDSNGVVIITNGIGFATAGRYRCRYRVLDSFGTLPEYNDPNYPHEIPGGRSPWADLNLIPQQFFTLYPHTHDNTFLGFVVGSNKVNEESSKVIENKKDKAVLYAKLLSYCQSEENRKFLKIVSEYFQIEATAIPNAGDFSYLHNNGPVSGAKVQELLKEAKVFVGCGFPYEGPGPLEAMAVGTPFIQPKFKEPKNKMNDKFFDNKPTLRLLTSQSPYMEEFVGEPYVYTIDITDEENVRKVLTNIKKMKPLPPKIPKEFTNEGMLERLHVFTEHMDFCNVFKERWPPISHMKMYVADLGQSCKDLCMKKGLVCERSFFDDINNQKAIESSADFKCSSIKNVVHLHAPSFDSNTRVCNIQLNVQLFSCSHAEKDFKQVCPCRDYEAGQSALCNDCL